MDLLHWKLFPLLALLASFLFFFYIQDSSKSSQSGCSLFPHSHYWIASKRIVTPQGIISGAVEIKGGSIVSIVKNKDWSGKFKQVVDYGNAVVMPGLIDV
ncbi:allantoinase [Gossypium australe]|nr:allantoinase [Gossypium australe]